MNADACRILIKTDVELELIGRKPHSSSTENARTRSHESMANARTSTELIAPQFVLHRHSSARDLIIQLGDVKQQLRWANKYTESEIKSIVPDLRN